MPSCIVRDCSNRTFRKSKKQEELENEQKITFHSFPKNEQRRKKWCNLLKLCDTQINSKSVVCSLHFHPNQFDTSSQLYVRLKSDADPYVSHIQLDSLIPDSKSIVPSNECPKEEDIAESPEELSFTENAQNMSISHISAAVSPDPLFMSKATPSEAIPSTSKISRATSISPTAFLMYNSPSKKKLRDELEKTKKDCKLRMRTISQQNRRMKKKIATMKNILEAIKTKNLLQEEELYNIKGISAGSAHLLQRVVRKSKKKPLSQQYSPELRTFATTLHYYSPRAYSYVRDTFNTCLPHPKTLYRWYCSVDGEPGFNKEALDYIKERINKTNHLLVGALMIDEMAIRTQVEFDGNKFYGKCDMGNNISVDEENIAKEALVFLVVGINELWKVAVGYFLINGITGEQKKNLIIQCLRLLHNCGICIKSITCDGTATNLSMIRTLQCDITNTDCLQGYFPHPVTNDKVHVFLDPCHMLKLLRNALGDYKSIVNGKGQTIKWEYIVELHKLQEAEGLHVGNKLRQQHIEYHKKKMNVRLAAQVCSASVSKALKLCRTELHLDAFQNSEATEEFLDIINDLFDIFNSKNLRQKFYKCPINPTNSKIILQKLEDCKQYLLSLTLPNGQLLVHSNRKTGFLGFLMNIENLKVLYHDICETKLLPYIPMYQISQDHLEIFFGCIRAFGRQNNNPNVRQFKTAFKRLLVRAEIKAATTGNCIELVHIPILRAPSKPVEVINATSPVSLMIPHKDNSDDHEDDLFAIENDHSYILSANSILLSQYCEEIVIYLAGFIVRHLTKHVICDTCITALKNQNEIGSLIKLKSRGSLLYPSQSVVTICRETEKAIRFYINEQSVIITNKYNINYIANRVLNNINMEHIFLDLISHSSDQDILSCHRIQLIKSIIFKYVKTRYFYISKNTNNCISKRQFYNKLVLFSGQ